MVDHNTFDVVSLPSHLTHSDSQIFCNIIMEELQSLVCQIINLLICIILSVQSVQSQSESSNA